MKKSLLLFFVLLMQFCFTQKQEKLRYFISADSLVGVKNSQGKIIIPVQFSNWCMNAKNGEIIEDDLIYFCGSSTMIKSEKNAAGYFFDRTGKFLYQPFLFDNGADYFSEGVRRFVKNGKVGFVDQNGKIVIEAKHDFASPFNYGYTEFCNGCDWEKTEDEHKSIVGGTWGVMNFKGEQIASHNQKTSEKDIEIFGEYYPYPFIYSEKEKEILAFFDKQTGVLSDIYYVNYSSKIAESNKKLYFEITEKLKENFPYYRVNTYDNNKNAIDSYFEFLVSKNGKMMVKLGYKKNIPFEKWLAQAKKEIKDYQNRNKDNPNKMIKF